jgi:hypothetical protein
MMGTASKGVVGYGNAVSSAASSTAIRMPEMKSKVKEEAERDAARILRASWGTAVPVEPVAIAHELGIRVLEAQLDGNTLGALLKEPQEDPTILLNQQDSRNRRRFTCAHELGHYVLALLNRMNMPEPICATAGPLPEKIPRRSTQTSSLRVF